MITGFHGADSEINCVVTLLVESSECRKIPEPSKRIPYRASGRNLLASQFFHGVDPFYSLIHCVVALPVENLKFCKTISPSRRITYPVSETRFFLGVVPKINCVVTLVVESFGFRSIILSSKRVTHRVSHTNLIALTVTILNHLSCHIATWDLQNLRHSNSDASFVTL